MKSSERSGGITVGGQQKKVIPFIYRKYFPGVKSTKYILNKYKNKQNENN